MTVAIKYFRMNGIVLFTDGETKNEHKKNSWNTAVGYWNDDSRYNDFDNHQSMEFS